MNITAKELVRLIQSLRDSGWTDTEIVVLLLKVSS